MASSEDAPKTLEMRVAELEDKLAKLQAAPAAAPMNCVHPLAFMSCVGSPLPMMSCVHPQVAMMSCVHPQVAMMSCVHSHALPLMSCVHPAGIAFMSCVGTPPATQGGSAAGPAAGQPPSATDFGKLGS